MKKVGLPLKKTFWIRVWNLKAEDWVEISNVDEDNADIPNASFPRLTKLLTPWEIFHL